MTRRASTRFAIAIVGVTACRAPMGATPTPPHAAEDWEERLAVEAGAKDARCAVGDMLVLGKVIGQGPMDTVVVEGCDERLTYVCSDRCVLTARLPLHEGPTH